MKRAFPKMTYVLVELPGVRLGGHLLSVNFKALVIAVRYGVDRY